MLILDGEIKRGYGAASPNLKWQMQFFKLLFPEVKDCYLGTINVELKIPIRIVKPDFKTAPIKWHPDHPGFEEVFSFTRIKFEINSKNVQYPVAAWIYDPEQSPHHRDPFYYEVIAPLIDIRENKTCKVYLDRTYRNSEFIFVE